MFDPNRPELVLLELPPPKSPLELLLEPNTLELLVLLEFGPPKRPADPELDEALNMLAEAAPSIFSLL